MGHWSTQLRLLGVSLLLNYNALRCAITFVYTVTHTFQYHPYKLLLYEKGCFFKAHQDTPRSDRHFGSLVIVPPCKHTGGDLRYDRTRNAQSMCYSVGLQIEDSLCYRVKHLDKEENFNFSSGAKKSSMFVAFFTDCEHEISELTKGITYCLRQSTHDNVGFRMSLVYHLFRPEHSTPVEIPLPVADNPIIKKIQDLRDLYAEMKAKGVDKERGYGAEKRRQKPDEIVYPLSHKYRCV